MKKLRTLLRGDGILVVPGVYDAVGARIAQREGFEATFQTGYGTSASMLGMPDYGFVGAAETADNARRICRAVSIPVIVDADTGYGNPLSVWKTVGELEAAGAAGMFLEDQRWPKRCGHMKGKEVIPQEEYAQKLGAALDARQSKDFVIVARTDARATSGLGEAIERGRQNRKTGADAIFIESPRSVEEMREIGRSVRAPLVANMVEGGVTPVLPSERLREMGFRVALYPLAVLFANAFATARALRELRETGTTARAAKRMMRFDEFNELVGLREYRRMEDRYRHPSPSSPARKSG